MTGKYNIVKANNVELKKIRYFFLLIELPSINNPIIPELNKTKNLPCNHIINISEETTYFTNNDLFV